jgi:geranylgeranyl pyrophosphate synthase
VAIASCVELIHNASLVHDDLEDRQQFRRGVETVHSAYGFHVALCSGDLLLSAAYATLARFSNATLLPALLSVVHARIAVVIGGQCARLVPIGDEERDMDAYDAIASAKSGALLSLPLELALEGSSKGMWSEDARRAAEHFAIGYQITDDIEDVEQDRGTLSVNALLVIEAACRCQINEASEKARSHALKHLAKAASLAGSLPNGSGALLRELAKDLSHRLEAMG